MLKIFGDQPPRALHTLSIGGKCPHCKKHARFRLSTHSFDSDVRKINADACIACYHCEACTKPVGIYWKVNSWDSNGHPTVQDPRILHTVLESYEFEHVPPKIRTEIEEALDCLSVGAYNGFAALCRRSVQAICSDLGAEGSSKVQKQITEMLEMTGLADEWEDITKQILLTGHDGAHPHLPEVNQERAALLLSLLQDLTYQLYTRPGKVKEAASLRKKAIEAMSDQ